MSAPPLKSPLSSPLEAVVVRRVSPDDVEPIASTFFAIAGLPMVQTSRPSSMSPSLPAANTSRFSGFWVDCDSAKHFARVRKV